MKLLTGKVSIVTGAARGIGAAIALKLAEQGSHIAFTYVSDSSADKANSLVTEIEKLGVKAKAYKANAADFAACAKKLVVALGVAAAAPGTGAPKCHRTGSGAGFQCAGLPGPPLPARRDHSRNRL
jgi:NAD(P)-dependent dehydrogenase (short-subunit alcohol dehydrogenase family)